MRLSSVVLFTCEVFIAQIDQHQVVIGTADKVIATA